MAKLWIGQAAAPQERDRILHKLLSDFFCVPEAALILRRPNGGKPFFEKADGCHFNVSYSGEWMAIAASDQEIGVDIERRRGILTGALRRCFTEREQDYVQGDERRFFELWTRKEAYVKHSGQGLKLDLRQVCPLSGERAADANWHTLWMGDLCISVYGRHIFPFTVASFAV
ncbi:MAG: 4'-phosphopantetheinyl transferase superfamily protein [Ndongobacter sp.]|nr:4'-phosphopantetheinyl transferase superfamily protein [Ndongobacter sp.]